MLIGTMAVGMVALWFGLDRSWPASSIAERARRARHRSGRCAAAVVDQRRGRARLRSADDPILAAMGLPEEDATCDAACPPRRHVAGMAPRPSPQRRKR